jgi:hypothetical protein
MRLGDRSEAAAAPEQLSIGAIGARPAPLLVMVNLAGHIPGRQLHRVVHGEASCGCMSSTTTDIVPTERSGWNRLIPPTR